MLAGQAYDSSRFDRFTNRGIVAMSVFLGGFGMRTLTRWFFSALTTVATLSGSARALAADPAVNLRRTVVVDVAEKTKNAVVYISTTKMAAVRVNPFGNDPMFAPWSRTEMQHV